MKAKIAGVFASCLFVSSTLQAQSLDTAKIDAVIGIKGVLNTNENVFKVTSPRNDLKIAVDGNLKGKSVEENKSVSEMRGQEKEIVDRFVFDSNLRTGIFDGWKRSGFVA